MQIASASGIPFGIEGFDYGETRVRSVTFMLNGNTRVCDHRGNEVREMRGTHAEVIARLKEAGYEWYLDENRALWLKHGKDAICTAGFPQLPYDELKELPAIPVTPLDELMKIRDKLLRVDAMKARKEADASAAEQLEEAV